MWEEFLKMIGFGSPAESAAPAPRPTMQPSQPVIGPAAAIETTPEMERMAKERGFNNAQEMILWERQRQKKHKSSVGGDSTTDVGKKSKTQGGGVFSKLTEALDGAGDR